MTDGQSSGGIRPRRAGCQPAPRARRPWHHERPARGRGTPCVLAIAIWCFLAVGPGRAESLADKHWASGFTIQGADFRVDSLAVDGKGNVYAGGAFTVMNDMVVNGVAKWDGSSWSPLGSGIDGIGDVYALAVDGNGNVYAGGGFRSVSGESANGIAKWNGSSWSALGSGMDGSVRALVVDKSGNVYAGGTFTTAGGVSARNIAKWNGSSWSALGSGMGSWVNALAVDGSGNVYVGGPFSSAGGVSAHYIARWNGSSWYTLGSGTNGEVYALAVDGNGNVYAGGQFGTAGGVSANNVARWNGSSWSAVGSGVNGEVGALAVDGNGNLYAAGGFGTASGVSVNHIAKWNGSTWSALGLGTGGFYYAANALTADGSGNVYAGGLFTAAGGVGVCYIAKWDGAAWSGMGPGMGGGPLYPAVFALAVGSGGNVYVGGLFSTAAGASANYIAKLNGSSWLALGSGMNDLVGAIVADRSGQVYAGGSFTMAGGVNANHIAQWDGSSWLALGSGTDGDVSSLALDSGGNVYAGGGFQAAGGEGANYIAKWNGLAWSALGSGMNGFVFALALDSGDNVYAGGNFTTAGGVSANHIAKWDGTSWWALGSGMSYPVHALAVDGSGNVYAGCEAGYVSKWNGSSWSLLGGGMSSPGNDPFVPTVYALVLDGMGNLYAGGGFTQAGQVSARFIARWDGSLWSALGSGMNGSQVAVNAWPDYVYPYVDALAADGSGNLYAGGSFTRAGNKVSAFIAKWSNATPANTAAPVVTGTYLVGQQFTASAGNWTDADGDPLTYSCQWQRADNGSGTNGANIGTDSSAYTVAASEAHKYVRVTVTANDGTGGKTASSTAWVQVGDSAPVNTAPPVVSGTYVVGGTLTTTNGNWTDPDGDALTYAYQWQRADDAAGTNAAPITGATASSYTLMAADAQEYVGVQVTADDGYGGAVSAQSSFAVCNAFGPLAKFALALSSPQMNGAAFTGANTLTAQDAFGNTVTTFDASVDSVTIVANAPLVGDVYGLGTGNNNALNRATDFVAGVADLTALGMRFVGNYATGTFTATSATGKSGTSGSVTINGAGPGQPGKDMQVVAWLTIPASVSIAWGAGTTGKTAGDVTLLDWTVKDATGGQLGRGETCVSNDPNNGLAMNLENTSNTGTKARVFAAVANSGGWNIAGAPGTDTFAVKAQLGTNPQAVLAATAQELTGTARLAKGADQPLVVTVLTPTDITRDAGVQKTIFVVLTATPE